ncbi:hypothetical protein ACWDBD_03770 [Streptomyces sp. NPDC001118]
MTRDALTLLAFGDDLALIAVSGWWIAAELRWRRRYARQAPALEERCATPWTKAPAPQPHGTPTTTGSP